MSQAPLSSKTVAAEATEKRISPDRPCRSSGPLFPDSLRGGLRSPLRSRSGTGTRGFGLGAVSRVHVAFRLPFSRRRHVLEFGVGEWLRTLEGGVLCRPCGLYSATGCPSSAARGGPGTGGCSHRPCTPRQSGSPSAGREMPFDSLRVPSARSTLALSSLVGGLHLRRATSAFPRHLVSGPHLIAK